MRSKRPSKLRLPDGDGGDLMLQADVQALAGADHISAVLREIHQR
jgi:hypothetical protein